MFLSHLTAVAAATVKGGRERNDLVAVGAGDAARTEANLEPGGLCGESTLGHALLDTNHSTYLTRVRTLLNRRRERGGKESEDADEGSDGRHGIGGGR